MSDGEQRHLVMLSAANDLPSLPRRTRDASEYLSMTRAPQFIGHWVFGHWSLIGHWGLVIGHLPRLKQRSLRNDTLRRGLPRLRRPQQLVSVQQADHVLVARHQPGQVPPRAAVEQAQLVD